MKTCKDCSEMEHGFSTSLSTCEMCLKLSVEGLLRASFDTAPVGAVGHQTKVDWAVYISQLRKRCLFSSGRMTGGKPTPKPLKVRDISRNRDL